MKVVIAVVSAISVAFSSLYAYAYCYPIPKHESNKRLIDWKSLLILRNASWVNRQSHANPRWRSTHGDKIPTGYV